MIISDKYKYLFIEFPQTGCSAVGRELMEQYEGQRILFKHAQLHEFMKSATKEQRQYFIFSTIRNPMDVVVSKYFKYLSDHENYAEKKVKHGRLRRLIMPKYEEGRRDFILNNKASFEDFFLKYYTLPYSAWSILSHHKLQFLMRFENLGEDFNEAVSRIGAVPKRALPLYNQTGQKIKHFSEYYESTDARVRAVEIFGPYMKEWGYEFPSHWMEASTVKPSEGMYRLVNTFRKLYWKILR
jgi:hypothetical protein